MIQASHHAHAVAGKRHHYPAEVIGTHPDITIVDQQILVPRLGQHLQQVADFAIHAALLRADHQLDLPLGKFAHELLDERHGGVVGVAHAEDDFVLRIILQAVAAKTFVSAGIGAQHRLQDVVVLHSVAAAGLEIVDAIGGR